MTHDTAAPAVGRAGSASDSGRLGRAAVRGAAIGFFVDMFDVYLPVIALTPAMAYFEPNSLAGSAKNTIFYTIFAASLVGRPIGSIIFGHFGDRIGRRRTTLISVAGFAVCTGLMVVLPGYSTLGYGSVAILILLRVADGVFLGGGYTGANPLAMEYAPKEKRGLYGALVNSGYPGSLVAITLLTMLVLQIAPAGGASSAYVQWGWRVPFAVGFLMSVALFVYYYRTVPESQAWLKSKKSRAPLRDLMRGRSGRRLAQIFVMMCGAWLTLDAVQGAISGVLKSVLNVSNNHINIIILVGAAVGFVLFPFVGQLGQRVGRRNLLIAFGIVNLTVTPVLYALLVRPHVVGLGELLLYGAVIQVLTITLWANFTAYITESFATSVRASGYGIGYSLASIPPAFYSFYMLGLGDVMPYRYTQVALLAFGGLLLAFGAWLGPDSRNRVLAEPAEAA